MAEPSAQPDPTRPTVPVLSLQSLREQLATRELQLAAHRQHMPVIPPSKEQQ